MSFWWKLCDTSIQSLVHDFFIESDISAIWGRFQLIFNRIISTSVIFLLQTYLTSCPRKCVTRFDPTVVMWMHQVWSRYDLPFPTHGVYATDTLRDLVTSNNGHTRRGKFFTHVWNRCPRFLHPLCNLNGSTIKMNWVISQNSVLLCVKGHTTVCACDRSRDLGIKHTWNPDPNLPIHYTTYTRSYDND